jgi:hypothetical protein
MQRSYGRERWSKDAAVQFLGSGGAHSGDVLQLRLCKRASERLSGEVSEQKARQGHRGALEATPA